MTTYRKSRYIRNMPIDTLLSIKLKTLCRLHFEGRGTKYISMITGISRKTVQKNVQTLRTLQHLTEEDVMKMGSGELMKMFSQNPLQERNVRFKTRNI